MDPSRFPSWGRDRQQHPPPAGRKIDGSSPDQQLRLARQPSPFPRGPVPAHVDSAFLSQQSVFTQYIEQAPRFSHFGTLSQPFLAPNLTTNSPLAAIVNHSDIATHRDIVCHYLRLAPSLWTELYKPEVPTLDHQFLIKCLSRKYGRLPDDLWILLDELREQHDFPQLQHRLVNDFLSAVPQQSQSQTPAGQDGRSLGSHGIESEEISDILVQVSSPMPGQAGQATATTPISGGNSRSKSQSPYQRMKGRAPKGERFKCPYTNCKHEPFRNAGNFANHMRNRHAESEYRKRHPSEYLMPDTSTPPDHQGDGTSSAATNASDSPLEFRSSSHEYGVGDWTAAVVPDRLGSAEDSAYRSVSHDALRASTIGASRGLQPRREANVDSGLTHRPHLQDIRFGSTDQHDQPNFTQGDNDDDEPVGFAEFQLMEERRRSEWKE